MDTTNSLKKSVAKGNSLDTAFISPESLIKNKKDKIVSKSPQKSEITVSIEKMDNKIESNVIALKQENNAILSDVNTELDLLFTELKNLEISLQQLNDKNINSTDYYNQQKIHKEALNLRYKGKQIEANINDWFTKFYSSTNNFSTSIATKKIEIPSISIREI